jgi:hypothetical protein
METRIFNIDSRNRDKTTYTSTSQFKYDIADDGSSKIKNVLKLEIKNVIFPMTFHHINSVKYNNYINIDGVDYSISSGTYSTANLISALNTATSSVSGLTFSYDVNTQKTTITTSSSLTFTFTNNTSYDSLGTILGFTSNTYTINGTKVSENVLEQFERNSFFLKINDFGEIKNKGKNYIAKIITYPFESTKYKASKIDLISKEFNFSQPTDIRVLDIDIVDHLNNNVSLNGGNFSFTIEITSINNSLLKKYHELNFEITKNGGLKEMILYDYALKFFKKENNKSKHKDSNFFNHNSVGNSFLNHMNENNLQFQQKVSTSNNLKNVDSWQ